MCLLFRPHDYRMVSGRPAEYQPTILSSSNDFGCSSTCSSDVEERETEYYNGNINLPVYTKNRQVIKSLDVMNLLIRDKDFLQSKVCTSQPLHVEHHLIFIVDMNSLLNVKDIKCDDMGVWINSSCHKLHFNVMEDETDMTISATKLKTGDNVVTLKREYFSLKHDAHGDVRKRIDTVISKYVLNVKQHSWANVLNHSKKCYIQPKFLHGNLKFSNMIHVSRSFRLLASLTFQHNFMLKMSVCNDQQGIGDLLIFKAENSISFQLVRRLDVKLAVTFFVTTKIG